MRRLNSLEDSELYRKIDEPDLKSLVRQVAKQSAVLLGTVVRHMPLFTLHDERHILNVIGWMERLLEPKDAIAKMGQLECALCILAAYTHDLGMTLTDAEYAELVGSVEYRKHRDGFADERLSIERLRQDGQHARADLIEGHILTDYLRRTHADERGKRLRARLAATKRDFVYRNFEFRERLEILTLSHNQGAGWLRAEFGRQGLNWHTTVDGERVNFAFVSLLLRVGDILDFDASRTPPILFRHLGLDDEFAGRFVEFSAAEWRKHMAITSAEVSDEGRRIAYVAENCPHPLIDKGIRDFVEQIERERRAVHEEARLAVEAVTEDRKRLPSSFFEEAKARVTPARENGRPSYIYQDWSFQLDQQGDPTTADGRIALRRSEFVYSRTPAELAGRAGLRLRAKYNENPTAPVDGVWKAPGHFTVNGPDEALEVKLSWGEEDGRAFVRVEDNGVGMTKEAIERYFTRIGKSFYRSPEFESERAEMRRQGLIATPISRFGIGVLSCFMIADPRLSREQRNGPLARSVQTARVRVQSRAAGSEEPWDLEVSGPGSLFWLRPG